MGNVTTETFIANKHRDSHILQRHRHLRHTSTIFPPRLPGGYLLPHIHLPILLKAFPSRLFFSLYFSLSAKLSQAARAGHWRPPLLPHTRTFTQSPRTHGTRLPFKSSFEYTECINMNMCLIMLHSRCTCKVICLPLKRKHEKLVLNTEQRKMIRSMDGSKGCKEKRKVNNQYLNFLFLSLKAHFIIEYDI